MNPASELAKRKWESMTKTERRDHMEKMTKKATEAREKKLSPPDLAQVKVTK